MFRITYSSLLLFPAILFWIYALLFYTSLNYAAIFPVVNRAILFGLILACIGFSLCLNGKRWLRDVRDPVGFSIFFYFLYIFFSFILSILLGNIQSKDINSFILQCFLPILFYFVFKSYKHWSIIVYIIVLLVFLNALIAIAASPFVKFDIPIITQITKVAAFKGGSGYRLYSFIGNSSTLGFSALLCIAIYIAFPAMRFKYIVLPVMIVTVLSTRQRAVWVGVLILILLIIYFSITLKGYAKRNLSLFALIPVLGTIVYLFFAHYMDQLTVIDLLRSTLDNMTPADAFGSRASQQVIYNNSNPFFILFGEGFGKYSPLITDNALSQPDASYYMIFNETGIVGMLVFFNMFFQIVRYSLRRANFVLLFLVFAISVGLLGNRYLWFFPVNYLFYSFVGIFQNTSSNRRLVFENRLNQTGA